MGPTGLLLGVLALYGAVDIYGHADGKHALLSSKEDSVSKPEYHGIKEVDLNKGYIVDRKTDFIERNPEVLPDGRVLVEGDMLLTKEQLTRFYSHVEDRKAINPDFYNIPGFLTWNARWPADTNGDVIIKYLLTNSSAGNETIIKQALQHWMDHTCLQFQEVTTGGSFSHIYFSKTDPGCFSSTGRIPGFTGGPTGQKISLGKDCETLGTVVHEVGHAIGFFHEQSRADRDTYVKVLLENVLSGQESNFNKETKSNSHGVPYDYTSVMHYGDKLFTKNGKMTLSPKDPTLVSLIGQRTGLSFRDAKLANIIYNCTQKWEKMCNVTANPCQNEGYIGKNCSCLCPPGTTGNNCEQVIGPYYPALPCGGVVTTTNPLSSPFFPGTHNTSLNCVWLIRAPVCQMPKITITAFRTYFRSSNGICDIEGLEIRTDSLYNGTLYCGKGTTYDPNNQDLTSGQSFTATGRELVLNFFSRFLNATGFSATVQFVNSNNCTSTTTMSPTTQPATTTLPTTKPPTTVLQTTKPPTTLSTTPPTPDPCTMPLRVFATGRCSLKLHGTKWTWSQSRSYSPFTCNLYVRTPGCPKKLDIRFLYFPCRPWSTFCLIYTPLLPLKPHHKHCSSNPICKLAGGKHIDVPTSNFDMQVNSHWWSTRPFFIQVVQLPSVCHKRIVLSTTSPTATISTADARGSKNCEWFIQAPPGRKIKVTFKRWTLSRACLRAATTGGGNWRRFWLRRCQRQIRRCQSRRGGLLISPIGDVFYKVARPLCSQTIPSAITSSSNQMTVSYQRIIGGRRRWRKKKGRRGKKRRGRRSLRRWRKKRWRRRRRKARERRRLRRLRRRLLRRARRRLRRLRRRLWRRAMKRLGRLWRKGRRWWRKRRRGKWHCKRRRCGKWRYTRTFPNVFEATILLV